MSSMPPPLNRGVLGPRSQQQDQVGEPVNIEQHEFKIPKKEISNIADMKTKWETSQAYHDLLGFISAMNSSVKGKKISDEYVISEAVTKQLELLEALEKLISDFPPIDQPQRFGNKAFRSYFDKLKETSEALVRDSLDEKYHKAIPEITVYLVESVGNYTRIDYGTGHELAYVAFLCCLFKIGVLMQSDAIAVVFKVFDRYLELVRKLQLAYRMEPAGSQGAWSLDDFQFVPFIWGSAQFLNNPIISPVNFIEVDVIQRYHKDYMFLSCIKYINSVKTGPFAEHSNQLWNISAVPYWSKVNSGLIKMYKADVLSKFPVMQHFLFGSLLAIEPIPKRGPPP
ncbi:serine/threonine-protein phosphatase 2A activator-like [Tubulanus polymorphus]|uniref:serine/threonine-protein phosphatase 2A activator-like n=1 Tax=Tubulanus polymorphus TaxID=672921 RepID=UPI003DA2AC72